MAEDSKIAENFTLSGRFTPGTAQTKSYITGPDANKIIYHLALAQTKSYITGPSISKTIYHLFPSAAENQ
jgi:hypothetical protein